MEENNNRCESVGEKTADLFNKMQVKITQKWERSSNIDI